MHKIQNLSEYKHLLSPRKRDAHKGLYGHVLVIGGNLGMAGSVRLAAEAALRCGAGLVSLATRSEHANTIGNGRPEIMVHGVNNIADLEPLLSRSTVIIIGPGLGQNNWSQELLRQTLNTSQPKVIDADALNLLARTPSSSSNWVLTPHVREAARLLNSDIETMQCNRSDTVRQLQSQYGGAVILKGANSLICTSNSLSLCPFGNPGMASGGMGDALSGVIGALLAQGLSLRDAAELGVCLHAKAGDLAAEAEGERGLLAMDLMPYLRRLVNDFS